MTDPKQVAANIRAAVGELYRRAPTLERAVEIANELHEAIDQPLEKLVQAWTGPGGRWTPLAVPELDPAPKPKGKGKSQ